MNTALLAAGKIWMPLQDMMGWLQARIGSPRGAAPNPQSLGSLHTSTGTVADRIEHACHATLKRRTPRRPLRVVRILENGQTSAQVGRMVISGRMADVCAELDRLAACEALPR
jgi:hypothetical protein